MKLSVIIPVYNEQDTIREIVEKVQRVDIDKELIIVDDGSTDRTPEHLCQIEAKSTNTRVIRLARNYGKGKAIRTGFRLARGQYVIVQDADLEYDPNDYAKLLEPLEQDRADVVYGSRFFSDQAHRALMFWHYIGNKVITSFCNILTDLNLSDIETCYKIFRRELIQSLVLEEDRFGIEPEITCKMARLKARIYEVGIAYHGRTYEDGKKIGVTDGFKALWCILLYRFKPLRFTETARARASETASVSESES